MTHLAMIAAAALLLAVCDRSSAFVLPAASRLSSTSQGILKSSHSETFTDEDKSEIISLGRERLAHYFDFPLDDWQLQAGGEICLGHNVIVCAPTGAGKTVVGEMALHLALEAQLKAIYTTPLKALSNQKFAELRATFGKACVGLSTGDMSINRDADLRVMTTEVYRNMAWRSSGLEGKESGDDNADATPQLLLDDELWNNGVVVLDEFHYMGQPGRGGVWEESVITTPAHTQIVGLSATLPNAFQLAKWMESVSGRKTILVEAGGKRPVPLRYLFATKRGLYPLFRDEDAGPGAPNGLLGLRGDGIPDPSDSSDDDDDGILSLPRGLEISPILKAAAQKRKLKVNSAIEKMKNQEGDGGGSGRVYSRNGGDWRADPRKGKLNQREERRERERLLKKEMRKEVPSMSMLIRRLEQKKLLPAILFLFSRAGCDNAAAQVCQQFMGPVRNPFDDQDDDKDDAYDENSQGRKRKQGRSRARKASNRMQDEKGRNFRRGGNYVDDDALASMLDGVFNDYDDEDAVFDGESPLNSENWRYFAIAGLLTYEQVKEVASRVATFNAENEEIAFGDDVVEQYLIGVGSHHAGMLPAHKAFVETLYRGQMMKLVFATETLAAGINMPARTTIICALAKRGAGSTMNLLETSNLLQMAGRAGRRGMDTDGTCVIMSTPFENEDDAASILVNEIKPITSQFAPSYSLAVNLIARGQGQVNVARRLVEKSFAMWEKRQVEADLATVVEENGDSVTELLNAAAHERFFASLSTVFQDIIENRPADFKIRDLTSYAKLLNDPKILKPVSRGYVGIAIRLNVERKTLQYLGEEQAKTKGELRAEDQELFGNLADEDQVEMLRQIEVQRDRVLAVEQEIAQHPFSGMALEANRLMESYPLGESLLAELESIRSNSGGGPMTLSGEDLSIFAKSVVTMKKKKKNVDELDPNALVQQSNKQVTLVRDATWKDMLALTKVLVSYGCLKSDWTPGMSDDALEASTFSMTTAGEHVGLLSFENSLWCLAGMGGAHDVLGVSSELDDFRQKMKEFESDLSFLDDDDNVLMDDLFGDDEDDVPTSSDVSDGGIPLAQQESMTLVEQLSELTYFELAGYVSCLIADGYRRGNSMSVTESFQKLTPAQQRAVQSALSICERLMEVQKQCGTGDTNTRCELDLATVEVVTAWASGCTWAEALEISGSAPGDLARMLGRVLDALRQIGNLSFAPVRLADVDEDGIMKTSLGVTSEIRDLCRDAARAMNRYPVKDPLPFDIDSSEVEADFAEEEEMEQQEEEEDFLKELEES
jgi:superfamily II RNA helicase